MPIYLYQNPKTGKVIEVIQTMSQKHEYFDNSGLEWKRVFTVPLTSIDTEIDPMSQRDFVEKTGKKKGTIGDLFDKSKELSAKREKIQGKDSVKEKYWKQWSKERAGKKPPKWLKDK